jgi:hypothetical protein
LTTAENLLAASHRRDVALDPSAVLAPVAPSERFDVLDALRGFALFGIYRHRDAEG